MLWKKLYDVSLYSNLIKLHNINKEISEALDKYDRENISKLYLYNKIKYFNIFFFKLTNYIIFNI